jgi:hypothetical protein
VKKIKIMTRCAAIVYDGPAGEGEGVHGFPYYVYPGERYNPVLTTEPVEWMGLQWYLFKRHGALLTYAVPVENAKIVEV